MKSSLQLALLLTLALAPATVQAASSYADIDNHALSISASSVTSLQQLAADLTAPARDQREMARAIFRWVAENVSYDVAGRRAGGPVESDPARVLQTGTAVCEGYAQLFQALAEAAGLTAAIIRGNAKDADYHVGDDVSKSDHTWNAVKIDGQWQLLDITWAAGIVDKDTWTPRFDDFFFLTPPDQFINSHFPDDPQWQLLPQPISREQYRRSVRLSPTFYRLGLQLDSNDEGVVTATKEAVITFTGRDNLALDATLQGVDTPDGDSSWARCERKAGRYQVRVRWPRPGRYDLVIYAKRRGDPGKSWTAATYRIEASDSAGPAGAFPRTYDALDKLGLKLDSPSTGGLRARGTATVTLDGPPGLQVWADLKAADGTNLDRRWTLCQRENGKYQVLVRWPAPGQYSLVVYAGFIEATGPFPSVASYHLDATGSALMFPRTYNEFAQFGVSLTSPMDGLLGAGMTVPFIVHVANAKTVAVGQNGQQIRLDHKGSDWLADITPDVGDLVLIVNDRIVARYEVQ